jgi:hypothetical protein
VLAHGLVGGRVQRVTAWEWVAGLTDVERAELRRRLDEDG